MHWLNLLLIILASFRLTHLLVFDTITAPLRKPFEAKPFIGELITCYWCCGVWISGLLLLLRDFMPRVGNPLILLLAVAGGQSLLENLVQRK
ncbi:MAG TPA: DUF1360 domain-containing protein [Symbiobacteriaceae bacterium]